MAHRGLLCLPGPSPEPGGDSRRRPVTVGELNRAHQEDRDLLLCAGAEEGWALLMRASCKPPAGQCRTLRCGTLYTLWIILPSLQLDDCLPESGGSCQTLTQANRLQTAVSFQDPLTSVRIQGFSHSVKPHVSYSRVKGHLVHKVRHEHSGVRLSHSGERALTAFAHTQCCRGGGAYLCYKNFRLFPESRPIIPHRRPGFVSASVSHLETASRINLVVGFIKILDLQTQRQTGVFCPPAPLLPQY